MNCKSIQLEFNQWRRSVIKLGPPQDRHHWIQHIPSLQICCRAALQNLGVRLYNLCNFISVQELLSLHCKTDDPWCRITYHQYRDHVGTPGSSLPVYTDSVHVFSGLHHGAQGLCLSAVRPTAAVSITSEVSENAQIILLMLYIARSMLSQDVRLSVHHTPVLCQNGWTYHQTFFTDRWLPSFSFLDQTLWKYSDEDPLNGTGASNAHYTPFLTNILLYLGSDTR